VGTYLKNVERKRLARAAARELLAAGTPFQDLSLKQVAAHLGWSLGTLHRAYSVTGALLNDLLLEYEDATVQAVYRVGSRGLAEELTAHAHAMSAWMSDPANVQMMRYQLSLGCRSEMPMELPLRQLRGTSFEFHRDVLIQVAAAAGEEYSDVNALAALVAASRDGLTYQYFSHGDRERWLSDNLHAVGLAVAFARPRKVRGRGQHADERWARDEGPGGAAGRAVRLREPVQSGAGPVPPGPAVVE